MLVLHRVPVGLDIAFALPILRDFSKERVFYLATEVFSSLTHVLEDILDAGLRLL